ncbi:single-stranded DNA endonuclease [Rhizobium altiplani]|uniref:Single-stranded DNA endonuclease n=1 Tax=Rhizobium altiplani TaxID=1864509 RepID=A0A109J7M5_9HYPH|nr:DUF2958 domain-containing protein [Rhizobium altiplani]KWV43840.1 single-stranded DNA endonuclease [Rhizobium altiplani]
MILLTPELRAQLIRNNVEAREADHIPVVKWFTPWANATWLVTEMEPDGRCFGLCDVGQGTPELGYVSVEELESIKGPFGLTIERDLHFRPTRPLSEYTYAARAAGRIVEI